MPDGGIIIANGEKDPLLIVPDLTNIDNDGSVLPLGTKYKIEFTIELINTGSGLTHQYKGVIKGKVS